MKKISLLFVFLGLVSCTTSQKIIGPDGTDNHLISCYETAGCYSKAREVCGGNYKIVNTSTETSGSNGVTGTEIKLLIKCESQNVNAL